jgi:MFS superfamily sulfate permease-like transporter
VVTALATLGTMLLLAGPIGMMPQATLAAIVIVYSMGLIHAGEFRAIAEVRRTELVWALVALAGVVLLGTLQGIVVAIVVSLFALAHQTADPPVHVLGRKRGTNVFRPLSKDHPDDETYPGLLLLRLEGRVFFANAQRIGEKIRPIIEAEKPEVVVLHMRGVPDLEYTALKMMTEAEERERKRGVALWLVGMNPEVFDVVKRSPLGTALGVERMHFNLEIAVEKFLDGKTGRLRGREAAADIA